MSARVGAGWAGMDRWLREQTAAYDNGERVCLDVDAAFAQFPALRPKSDVYTYDDGRAQLLLCLHGLLPIAFRGASYNIPIAVWLTRDYPRSPPIAYVVPTQQLLLRPSKFVDLSGRCSINYIQDWIRKPEPCNLAALLQAMQDHFSRAPPLYKSSSPRPAPQTLPSLSQPQTLPSLPLSRPQSRHHDRPALPPKPIASQIPVVPPRPIASPPTSTLAYPHTDLYNRPPPPLPQQPRVHVRPSILAPQGLYATDGNTLRSTFEQSRESTSPTTPNYRTSVPTDPLPTLPFPNTQSPPAHLQPPVPSSDLTHPPQPPPLSPPPNLLDDESPAPLPPAPAPPRPPNPELLQLHAHVHDKIRSEFSSLSQLVLLEADRLRAQQTDLLAGQPAIRDEMARLEAVTDVCRNVAARLRSTIELAVRNLAELRRKGDPEVDELVCSTSIVHNQLINLVAEDNAIEDTIYHLHRALNTGRIDLERFLRTTRVLAEEQFMKRALIDKIQVGMPMGTNLPYS